MAPTGGSGTPDEIDLTAHLVRIDTSDGGEAAALDVLADLLGDAGFEVSRPRRQASGDNLVARWDGGGRLVLSGHVDTVPYDASRWEVDPLGAEVAGGRMHGRGTSDMKGGVAAMTCAALDAARAGARGFTVAVTGAEELGCLGARAVAASGLLPVDPVLVVGESTGNEVRLGHKGATWVEATATGVSAHGSRPDLGVNAIGTLAAAIGRLGELAPGDAHGRLGERTVNVGSIIGGLQTNLVPDHAAMSVDVRTVPGSGADEVSSLLESCLGGGSVETILDLPPVWTEEDTPLTSAVRDAVASVTGATAAAAGVSYFSDAAVLGASPGAATYLVGPGDLDQPHTTDESCSLDAVRQARGIYAALLARWDDGSLA